MTQMRKVDVKHANGTTGTLDVETSESSLQALATNEGWSAALNGFDVDCVCESGYTEEEAIRRLCDCLDVEFIRYNGCL